MDWVYLAITSAALLGVYEVCKKRAVHGNAVIPVLFLSVCCAGAIWLPWALWPQLTGGAEPPLELLRVDPLGLVDHLRLLGKSTLVAGSWTFTYFALKHLPVSVATSIRATGPLWTLAGALLIYAERPSVQQWIGMAVILVSFLALSLAGRREGLIFHRNRWVGYMLAGTLLGAASGLYDKWLLAHAGYGASTLQAWFSIYLAVVLAPVAIGWQRRWWPRGEFRWRWSIPSIGVALLLADYVYFTALRDPEALVSIVSCLRRGSVLIVFVAGYFVFGERNYKAKTPCVLGILAGVVIIAFSG